LSAVRGFAPSIAAILLVVGVGQSAAQTTCGSAMKQAAVAELMFGRNIGTRLGVTEAKWSRFVEREITPRFPSGFSIVDAKGQWYDNERKTIIHESSKIVTIVFFGDVADDPRLREIVSAYKAQFKQQSVGLIVRHPCVSF
jgi:Protein of unknown function (DUF3574)